MTYKIKPLEEDFHNPFDDIEKLKKEKKKVISLSDGGGFLSPRKESFNINRVIYTKRPNGEYTVYSKTQFAKGEIIEIAPIIFVGSETKNIGNLNNYIFEIEKPGKNSGMWGVVLGYGSLYKHSNKPNVEYIYNKSNKQMYFKAIKTIQAHQELTINYGKEYWNERTNFNTVANINNIPSEDNNANIQPQRSVEENSIEPSAQDVTGKAEMKANSSPVNINPGDVRNDPARGGHSPFYMGFG